MSLWWINDSGQNTLKGEPAFEAADGVVFRNHMQAEDYSAETGLSYSIWLDDFGNPGNPENQIHLYNSFILHCLYTVPQAMTDFDKIFPSLNPAEQTRFTRMLERAPHVTHTVYRDQQTRSDRFTNRYNRIGVRQISGRYGGTRNGGNL